jgi:hypothetical protein
VPDEERINLGAGDAILLDSLGARAIRVTPSDEIGLMLDLGGRLNKRPDRDVARYLLSPGQAAELVGSLVAASQRAAQESPEGVDFAVEFERALAREQEHLIAGEDNA